MIFPFENTFASLPPTFFQKVAPTPVKNPQWIAINHALAAQLGIDPASLESPDGLATLSGNAVPQNAAPLAMAYAGHQFGNFVPQLGDGRAILLGEVAGFDLQLKGAGPTPFSRRGDGRSALGPVLREYLVSEAMAALGVPTTRALAAVTTGELVIREEPEPGAILTRIARSHLRIGTAQFFAARNDLESLQTLVAYAHQRHQTGKSGPLALLEHVIAAQAKLIAQWMGLGFIHGVMNTDNMSLSGETIDYGPCAFLDEFDPTKAFSFIDSGKRYAYQNQPAIAQWNLARLAETLIPLLHSDPDQALELAREQITRFPDLFQAAHLKVFAQKIGLPTLSDESLVQSLLDLLAEQKVDFTLAFHHLSDPGPDLFALFKNPQPMHDWITRWHQTGSPDLALMKKTNPGLIPRNHLIEQTITAARSGDFSPFHELLTALQSPFDPHPSTEKFQKPPTPEQVVCHTFCGT